MVNSAACQPLTYFSGVANILLAIFLSLSSVAATAATLPTVISAVGARENVQGRINDELSTGNQQLASRWHNGGALEDAWFTVDLGAEFDVTDIRIAPQPNQDLLFEIHGGLALDNGMTTALITSTCALPSEGPVKLRSCPVAFPGVRYLTIRELNRERLSVYGIEIDGTPSAGDGNFPPTASIDFLVTATPFVIDFDATSSSDADGSIDSYVWDFGDGNDSTGSLVSHGYAGPGSYDVQLTVVDDDGASGQTTAEVIVIEDGPEGEVPLSLVAVGSRLGISAGILDRLPDDTLNLTSSWASDTTLANAWFTLDASAPMQLTALQIAPRDDIFFQMQITVGDELQNNKVHNGQTFDCESPGVGDNRPTALLSCPVAAIGRYITVESTNRAPFRVYAASAEQAAGNQPPTITPIADILVTAGFPVVQTVVATDADGPAPLTLGHSSTIPGDPLVLTDDGDGSGELRWNDTSNQIGAYDITISATDADNESSSTQFQIEVVDNQSPDITPIEDQIVTEGTVLTFDVIASDADDSEPVVFSESHALPGLPLVLTDNQNNTASFSWQPMSGDSGTYPITIQALDSSAGVATEEFEILVVENQPPQFVDLVPLFAVEEQTLATSIVAVDPDSAGEPMITQTNTLPGQPELLTDLLDGTAAISYTPNDGEAGSYDLTLTALSNDGGTTQVVVPFTVTDNSEPGYVTMAAEKAPDLVNLTATAQGDWAHWFSRSDGLPNRNLGGGFALGNVDSLGADADISRYGYGKSSYAWTNGAPTNNESGTRYVGRVVSPGDGFSLSIPAGNDPRRITLYLGASKATGILSATLSDGSAVPSSLSITKAGGRTTQAVTIDYRSSTPGQMLNLEWLYSEPINGGPGWISVEAATYDGPPPNQPPSIDPIADEEVRLGESMSLTIGAADPDGPSPITFTQTNTLPESPDILTDHGDGTATLSWSRANTAPTGATYSITIIASDAEGASATESFAVTLPANAPPVVSPIANQIVTGGDELNLSISTNDPDSILPPFIEVDLSSLPVSATFTPDGTGGGLITWATTAEDVSTTPYPFTVTATDASAGRHEVTASIEVMPNQPPTIIPLVDRSVTEGRTLVVPLSISDPDDLSGLTVSAVTTLPNGFNPIIDLGNDRWELRWTPNIGDASATAYNVSVTATDGHGNDTTEQLYVRVLDADMGIEVLGSQPSYWKFEGEPTLLIGGSDADSIFHWDSSELIAHLDLLASVGGNYLRVAQNWRNFDEAESEFKFTELAQPWLKDANGKFDLDTDNPAYWDGLQRLLHETAQRGIVVQLELWDAYALIHRIAWPHSGWNPANNSSYTLAQTDLVDGTVDVTERNFFEAVPALNNDTILLSYQQRFIDKMLQVSSPYNHVIYQLDNESYLPSAVSDYWASYLHNALPTPSYVADSRRYHKPSFEQTNFQDPNHPDNVHPVSTPETYTFMDLAQNGGNVGQVHYENLRWYRDQVAAVQVRPINHTKLYAYAWPTGTLFRDRFALSLQQQTAKFWRTIFAGAAGVRFHRQVSLLPQPGLGLGPVAQNHIASAASFASRVQLPEMQPNQDLLLQRSEDEAYAMEGLDGSLVVFFTGEGDGNVELTTDGAFYVDWLNVDTTAWSTPAVLPAGSTPALQKPDAAQWIALLSPNSAPELPPFAPITLFAGESLSVPFSATDEDGAETLTLTLTSTIEPDPGLLTITGDGQGNIDWSPTNDQSAGTYNIVITATDDANQSVSQTLVVTLIANTPPTIAPIADQTRIIGETLSLAVVTTDVDGPEATTITVTSNLPGEPALFTPTTNGEGTLIWSPVTGPAGTYTVTVTATDFLGNSSVETFDVTVTENLAPQITPIADQTHFIGETLSLTVVTTDVDGPGATTVTVANTLPGSPDLFTPTVDGEGTLNWSPITGPAGTYTVTVTATDTLGNSSVETFDVTVTENLAPQITPIADQTHFIGDTLSLAVVTTDADGPAATTITVTSNLPGDPALFTPTVDGEGTLNWSPITGPSGTYTVTVTATDTLGNSSVETFNVNVTENLAPQITPIADQTLTAGDTLSLPVVAIDNDGPGNISLAVSHNLPGAPDILNTTGSGTGTLTWLSGASDIGPEYEITVRATDSLGNQSEISFAVTVVAAPGLFMTTVGKPPTDISLSLEGTTDWVHWGQGASATAVVRKSGVTAHISDFTSSQGQIRARNNERPTMNWNDGIPISAAATTDSVRFRVAQGNNPQFDIDVVGDTIAQRFTLYLTVGSATATVTTTGAASYTTTLSSPFNKQFYRIVMDVPGHADSRDLSVQVALTDDHGNNSASIYLAGATLAPWVDTAPLSGLTNRPSNQSCFAFERPLTNDGLTMTRVFPGVAFAEPVAARYHTSGGTRWYIAQRQGKILWLDASDNTTTQTTEFVDLTNNIDTQGENGLLGFAFHPDFATNGYVYLSYVQDNGGTLESVLSRMTVGANGDSLDPLTEQILLTQTQQSIAHKGGDVTFGSDGFLYWSLGDDGSAGNDPDDNGQNAQSLLGTIVRIDVDSESPYAIPASNPFSTGGGAAEIYAYGFRNPWRISFDQSTGTLFAADVGQNEREEINEVIVGGNFGWRCYEGTRLNTNVDQSSCGLPGDYQFPIAEYDHTEGRSVTGGYVYRGTAITDLQGVYVFADFITGNVWGLFGNTAEGYERRLLSTTSLNTVAFGQSFDGEMIAVDYQGGLYALESAPPSQSNPLPTSLAATGCIDMTTPSAPVQGVLPYQPAARFWSDGAVKKRFAALPDSETLSLDGDADMLFPVGSVLVKNFELGGKTIETRLYMRHGDGGWGGYTYEWDSAETSATLVAPEGKTETINGQEWRFPSRGECSACHTAAAGYTLGLTAAQLNNDLDYTGAGGSTGNQLRTWEHIGMFDQPLLNAHLTSAQVDPENTQESLANRARSYLDTNCSQCHQPGGGTQSGLDLRRLTAIEATASCNALPQFGDLGLTNARIIAPGQPASSVLLQRMTDPAHRMPPVGSNVIDTAGATLINSWISGLIGCP